ncbi:MAG: glycosyltransferase family 39 protein [Fulvivirga sp.]
MSITKSSSGKPIYLLILLITFAAAYAYTFDSKVAMLGDNAYYYTLGKAIAQGDGYVNISRVNKSPNNHYPPGYPALISIALFLGGSIFIVKLMNGLLLLGSIYIIYELTAHLLQSEKLAFVIALLVTLNSHILYYSSIMMSEVPFLFFSGLSLLLFIKADKNYLSIKNYFMIGALLAMIVAYYIRSLGVALLAGYLLFFILERKWKPTLIYFGGLVIGVLPWFIRGQKLGGGSYLKQLTLINPYQPNLGQADFGDFVDRFFTNFERYITWEIPSVLFPIKQPQYGSEPTTGEWFVGLIVLALMFYGIFQVGKYKWLFMGYLLATFGILMIWPSVWIGVRFIVPMVPILLIGLFNALYIFISKVSLASGKKSFNPLLLLIFIFFSISPVNALNEQAKASYSPAWKNYFSMAKWVNRNLDDGVVVSCGKPALFYLEAETFTMRYKFAQNPAELIKDLEEKQVDYVVVDQVYGNTFRYLVPAIRQYPNRFEQVLHLQNPDTYLLKFKR